MPSIEESIETSLFARAAGLAALTGLPIAWPNVKFDPPTVGTPGNPSRPLPYLVVDHLPNQTTSPYTSFGDPDHHQGIIQITVVWPAGQGLSAATRIAADVADHFGRGTRLPASNPIMTIGERPSIAPAFVDGTSMRVPVSIRYQLRHRKEP